MKIFYKTAESSDWYNGTDKEVHRMKKEVRTAVYDDELQIEAYRFEGIVQPFPNHFHEYYVIGFSAVPALSADSAIRPAL